MTTLNNTISIPYRSYFVELPYLLLNNTCIVNGIDVFAKVINDNIIQIEITSGYLILSGTPIYIPDNHILYFDVSSYFDKNPLLIFCHFDINEKLKNSKLKYRVGIFDQITQELLPFNDYGNNLDIIDNTITILLRQINFKKNKDNKVTTINVYPTRDSLFSYTDNITYNINNQTYPLMPFDRITHRLSYLLLLNTGMTGGTGNTGGTSNTGGVGNTGGIGGNTRKAPLRYYIHNQCDRILTWTIKHNFNQKYVFVTCYDDDGNQIIPNDIYFESYDRCYITFDYANTGYAVITAGPVLQKDLKELYDSLKKLNFDKEKYKGDPGDRGEQGPIGDSGYIGLPGYDGKDGNQGPIGLTGFTGKIGEVGLSGCDGSIGFAGPPGIFGEDSETGGMGGIGATGGTGRIGPIGPTGIKGETFPGPQGPKGDTGFRGRTGGTGGIGQTGFSGFYGLTGGTGGPGLFPSHATDLETLKFDCIPEIYNLEKLKGGQGISAFSTYTIELVLDCESFQFPNNGNFEYYFIHEQPLDLTESIHINLFDHYDIGSAVANQIIIANSKYNNNLKYHPILKGFYYKK